MISGALYLQSLENNSALSLGEDRSWGENDFRENGRMGNFLPLSHSPTRSFFHEVKAVHETEGGERSEAIPAERSEQGQSEYGIRKPSKASFLKERKIEQAVENLELSNSSFANFSFLFDLPPCTGGLEGGDEKELASEGEGGARGQRMSLRSCHFLRNPGEPIGISRFSGSRQAVPSGLALLPSGPQRPQEGNGGWEVGNAAQLPFSKLRNSDSTKVAALLDVRTGLEVHKEEILAALNQNDLAVLNREYGLTTRNKDVLVTRAEEQNLTASARPSENQEIIPQGGTLVSEASSFNLQEKTTPDLSSLVFIQTRLEGKKEFGMRNAECGIKNNSSQFRNPKSEIRNPILEPSTKNYPPGYQAFIQAGAETFQHRLALERNEGMPPVFSIYELPELIASRIPSANIREEVKVRLKPENFGELRLCVSLDNGTLTVEIQTDTESAKEVINTNLHYLKEKLAESGIEIQQFSVSVGGDTSNQNFPSSPHPFPSTLLPFHTGELPEGLRDTPAEDEEIEERSYSLINIIA